MNMSRQLLTEQTLSEFIASTRDALGDQLVSALVFGSAATGQLRATSDVNLILVLTQFDHHRLDDLRESLRVARAVLDLHVMFITEEELPRAIEAFTLKFADIQRRHRVLYGKEVFNDVSISRDHLVEKTKQALLNFQLRMREHYVLMSLREEQMVRIIADAAAPLRASASALRQIRGESYLDGKEALETFVQQIQRAELQDALRAMSVARETEALPPGVAISTSLALLELSHLLFNQL